MNHQRHFKNPCANDRHHEEDQVEEDYQVQEGAHRPVGRLRNLRDAAGRRRGQQHGGSSIEAKV